jgi:hypothetical protein
MAITTITTAKDEDDNPKTVTELKFSVDNQKEDFRPKFEIYWYNDDDIEDMQKLVRASVTFPTLAAGISKDYKITKFTSKYLSTEDDKGTLYLKMYDADSKKLLAEAEKDI